MDQISLNFLALDKADSIIKIYRAPYNQELKEDKSVHVYKLKTTDSSDEYESYLTSFGQKEGFDLYKCSIWENNELTKRWLIRLLEIRANEVGSAELRKSKKSQFELSLDFVINSTNLGDQVISISSYFLKTEMKFGFLVDFKFRSNDDTKFNKEVQKLSLSLDGNYRSNRNYYGDKLRLIKSFIDSVFSEMIPLITDDNDSLNFTRELIKLPAYKLDIKKYIFNGGKTAPSQFQGVKSHGPYQEVDSEVRYLFLFEDRFKSFGNDIFLSLAGKTNPGTFSGMESMFKLPISVNNVDRQSIEGLTIDNLKEAISRILEYRELHSDKKVIVVLLEKSSEDNELKVNSPYYFLKYRLLKENIPLQVLSQETVGSSNTLKWSTSNIGLQIFAKLGGVPWLVKPRNSNCLILGIGSAHEIDVKSNKIKKYIAYSVCLDSSGLYKKLSILAEAEDKISYMKELQENLVTMLREEELNSYKKVVLHIPFKIKRYEIDSLQNALGQFEGIEFKVIKINTKNKFFGFSDHNTHVPYESSYVKLSKTEYLVWFEGLQYGKEIVYQRIANPVHIEFLNSQNTSQEDDSSYLQDVLNLSGANWRGFNAKSIPISIYYSKLIAEYTKAFEDFDGFDREIFSNNKPWFL